MSTIRLQTRGSSRANSAARSEVLDQLKADHKRVKKAYAQFKKLDPEEDAEACQAIVTQVLDELSLHAALEEELLYPAARNALAEDDLIDEAEVEHESLHWLIDQLRTMSPEDEKYGARFTVLCEYVMHHVKEEEKEMFPQLQKARLNWQEMAAEFSERRGALSPEGGNGDGAAEAQADAAGDPQVQGVEAEQSEASTATERSGTRGTRGKAGKPAATARP